MEDRSEIVWQTVAEKKIGDVSSAQWTSACQIIIDKPQSLDKRVAGQVPLGDDLFTFTPSTCLLSSLQDVYAREKKLYAKENDKVCDKSNSQTVQCTLDSEQCTLESEECTLESEQCTVESEQCTLEGEKFTLECEQSTTGLGSSWEKISSLIAQFGISDPSYQHIYRLQKLVSRNKTRFADFNRLVVIGESHVVFVPLTADSVAYKVELRGGVLVCSSSDGLLDQQRVWLETRLITRLASWLLDTLTSLQGSLRLVDLEAYCREYSRLKLKYAGGLISSWKESSDPEKSVHEDVGISAYLSCLWGDQKKKFVDLGCGNGLLVYILSGEGHEGVGFDLRRRGIWDSFPSTTHLKEESISPGLETCFPGVDWILGNHSDELTPWIPVIAALSGASTCYWVLPCCPFDFNTKYQRKNANNSVFRDYLNFVTEVGTMAGFDVEEDKMRIPSTKRICLVGRPREQNHQTRKDKIIEFVSSKIKDFKPREKVERVRNCTKIGADIIDTIVRTVVKICLEVQNNTNKEDEGTWNAGGEFSLGEVVKRLQDQNTDLNRLKSECGGLQTLLRNHHAIFQVQQGKVKLRVPGTAVIKVKNPKVKSRDCWFHLNHPDGCLLADSVCTWIHKI